MRYKYWSAFLLNEPGLGYEFIKESMRRGAPLYFIKLLLGSVLPQSLFSIFTHDERSIGLDTENGIDDSWRSELMELCNGISNFTNIQVRADSNY